MLSISTCKNQSTEVRDALHIPTYEFNYKVVTGCDKILQEYYITDRRKCENTKRFTYMSSTNRVTKGNSKDEQEGLEGWGSRRSADVHASATLL